MKSSCVILITDLQSELENFVVSERTKVQDEHSRQAVSKLISLSSGTGTGKKDRVQQMIDSWTNAFMQVIMAVGTFSTVK